jgi:hypothetical protein
MLNKEIIESIKSFGNENDEKLADLLPKTPTILGLILEKAKGIVVTTNLSIYVFGANPIDLGVNLDTRIKDFSLFKGVEIFSVELWDQVRKRNGYAEEGAPMIRLNTLVFNTSADLLIFSVFNNDQTKLLENAFFKKLNRS